MSLQTNLLKIGGVNALLVGTLAISAPAQALSALNFSGNIEQQTISAATYGFAFNVLDPNGIIVTDLSIFDAGVAGLSESHPIGLWNSSGTLLATATVNAGTGNPLGANGLFRTVDIPDILLPQGTNYAVGAFYNANSLDQYAFFLEGRTTPPEIEFVTGRSLQGSSLSFPSISNIFGFGAGSFEFVPVTPVPFEFNPVLGLSVLGGLWVGRRLIKKAKANKKSD